jgi:hypothetical protein
VPHAATMPIVTAFKICIGHRKNGLLNRLPAEVRFLYRKVTSPQPAWAPKTRFWGKTFYFVRKSPGSIPEAAGEFCIEQAQKTIFIGGSKLNNRYHKPNPATLYCTPPHSEEYSPRFHFDLELGSIIGSLMRLKIT